MSEGLEPFPLFLVEQRSLVSVFQEARHAPLLENLQGDHLRDVRCEQTDLGRSNLDGVEQDFWAGDETETHTAGEDLGEGVKSHDVAAAWDDGSFQLEV